MAEFRVDEYKRSTVQTEPRTRRRVLLLLCRYVCPLFIFPFLGDHSQGGSPFEDSACIDLQPDLVTPFEDLTYLNREFVALIGKDYSLAYDWFMACCYIDSSRFQVIL